MSDKKAKVDYGKIIFTIILLAALVFITEYKAKIEENKNANEITNTISANISIDSIPEYSGELVIDINNNVPFFTEKEITTDEFEIYSELDSLGRAVVAYANVCKNVMPPKGLEREEPLSYKPSGWKQRLYGENKSYHLYERSHLIAWQLGNENDNEKNLITGTYDMNNAMIPFETEVANWIRNKNRKGKDYHVLYRVTPIYKGNNLVASGVLMEAKSVEEEGISFNKYIYNVQSGIEINYLTGASKEIK